MGILYAFLVVHNSLGNTKFLRFAECGKFLALDLGGTNFRVLLIELGPHIFHMV